MPFHFTRDTPPVMAYRPLVIRKPHPPSRSNQQESRTCTTKSAAADQNGFSAIPKQHFYPYNLRPVLVTDKGNDMLPSHVSYDKIISLVSWKGGGDTVVPTARDVVASSIADALVQASTSTAIHVDDESGLDVEEQEPQAPLPLLDVRGGYDAHHREGRSPLLDNVIHVPASPVQQTASRSSSSRGAVTTPDGPISMLSTTTASLPCVDDVGDGVMEPHHHAAMDELDHDRGMGEASERRRPPRDHHDHHHHTSEEHFHYLLSDGRGDADVLTLLYEDIDHELMHHHHHREGTAPVGVDTVQSSMEMLTSTTAGDSVTWTQIPFETALLFSHSFRPSSPSKSDNDKDSGPWENQTAVPAEASHVGDLVIAELRQRVHLRNLERATFLLRVAEPMEMVLFPCSSTMHDPERGEIPCRDADTESRRQQFRYRMCEETFERLVMLESVRRHHDVEAIENDHRDKLISAYQKSRREIIGLAPMRRALTRWLYQRRARAAALRIRIMRLLDAEAHCRSAIEAEEHTSFVECVVSPAVEFEERVYRAHLLSLYARVVGSVMFSWVWLHQRCSLFQITFASVLNGAPRMSGRVCDHSLFHTLSELESFHRSEVAREREVFLTALDAAIAARWLCCHTEPSGRLDVEALEHQRYLALHAIRTQVMWTYQRRDVELEEMDDRALRVDREWSAGLQQLQELCSCRPLPVAGATVSFTHPSGGSPFA